jgi:deoxycytidylate deaminase
MKRSDRVFFNMARQVSFLSDYHGPHMGCVCVDGHRVVTSGHNAMKTNPMQHRYNRFRDFDPKYPARVHAEVSALNSLIGKEVDFSKLTLYVYREHKDGSPAMARPCKSCMALIKNLGIKKVFYTTDDGFAEEKIEY